ncbi:MAG: NAD(P)H-dependent oxidoreductase [Actinomycetaceae bacterium]|nr:NAD(P)H-dependent oxidoreductase [Actinomycetaceae bacterium]MDY6083439.1 NAD(P)H-dependent oxidoreductase [Actinomycetaceae bacterium]
MTKLGVFVGSIRDRSWNKKIADIMVSLFPDGWEAEYIDISRLPFYNQDWDEADFTGTLPQEVTTIRDQVSSMDAFLFVTPEYNRGIPGVLKNAIDVVSRPAGSFLMANKPALIASVSTGAISGFGANHSLRQSLMFLNMPVMAQPELYLGNIHSLFGMDNTDEGREGTTPDLPKDKAALPEGTLGLLQNSVDTFVDFAGRWL